MGGVDTIRGIGFQQAQAVLAALEVLANPTLAALRVEGRHDVVDVELLGAGDVIASAKQYKTRQQSDTWSMSEILGVLRKWTELPSSDSASFEFVTDGRLGPTASRLKQALEKAADGDASDLLPLLPPDTPPLIVKRLAGAAIRIDEAGVGALLLRAEREVAAALPEVRTVADAQEQATHRVDALFRLLFIRGGEPRLDARRLSRERIAEVLGISADLSSRHKWDPAIRQRYLEQLAKTGPAGIVPLSIAREDAMLTPSAQERHSDAQSLSELLHRSPALLAGRSGEGKSTTCRLLAHEGAHRGRVVLLANAETYLPGRLDALVADALADELGEDLPSATGRQALSDNDVTLVIDGASEVAVSIRSALAEDIATLALRTRFAQLVLVGRDVAVLRSLMPTSAQPIVYRVSPLDADRRLELAEEILERHGDRNTDSPRTLRDRVDRALGQGSGNPMLFSMAAQVIATGEIVNSRASLYRIFTHQMAARSGAPNVTMASAALGIVYARLLDEGRRHADAYEWLELRTDAAAIISEKTGSPLEPTEIDEAARRAGMIAPIGHTQTIAPVHDSFADYFAAVAHSRGLSDLPTLFSTNDEARLQFLVELGNSSQPLSLRIAGELPFFSVQIADIVATGSVADSLAADAADLLKLLLPEEAEFRLCLWHDPHGRIVAMQGDDRSGWLKEDTAREMMRDRTAILVDSYEPLAVAVKVWRQYLREALAAQLPWLAPRPQSLSSMRDALQRHAEETASSIKELVAQLAPRGHHQDLAKRVGPPGLEAWLLEERDGPFGLEHPVTFRRSSEVTIHIGAPPSELDTSLHGHTTAQTLLRESPHEKAADMVRRALNNATTPNWL